LGKAPTETQEILQTVYMDEAYSEHKHFDGLSIFKKAKRMWKMTLAVDH
jgi:hypothetical protein